MGTETPEPSVRVDEPLRRRATADADGAEDERDRADHEETDLESVDERRPLRGRDHRADHEGQDERDPELHGQVGDRVSKRACCHAPCIGEAERRPIRSRG
jgi:hypothetical protein